MEKTENNKHPETAEEVLTYMRERYNSVMKYLSFPGESNRREAIILYHYFLKDSEKYIEEISNIKAAYFLYRNDNPVYHEWKNVQNDIRAMKQNLQLIIAGV